MKRLLALATALVVSALLVPAAATSASQEARPHMGTCVGVPDDPLALEVNITGTCLVTHLGLDTFESSHTVIPTGFDPVTMVVDLAIVSGQGRHRAANGDLLFSEYQGTGQAELLTGRIVFEATTRFVGGTGRFAGASGASRIWGVVEDGVARFSEQGSITY